LLERLDREGATIGKSVPEEITVQGELVALREFVFEMNRFDSIPTQERDRVEQAKKNLRRERLQRRQQIERGDVSFEDGEELVESILGIDRALNALENLGPTDVAGEEQAKEAADRKRWMKFLRQVLGQDSSSGRSGRSGRRRL
jgi:hypothetical protein